MHFRESMKTTSNHQLSSFNRSVAWTLGGAALLVAFALASAQEKKIVIEGGPNAVEISDRDGKPEGKLTNRDIAIAASDQKGESSTVTSRKTVVTDVDNDGRLERLTVLRRELNVIDTKFGPLIRMDAKILFDFDKKTIKPAAVKSLNKVAEFIRLSKDGKVEVVGYADAKGSKEYNSDLAWERSTAVVNWLAMQEGFADGRFRAIGRGEEGAIAPNTRIDGTDNPEGRKLNRRVEILIRNQAVAAAVPAAEPELK